MKKLAELFQGLEFALQTWKSIRGRIMLEVGGMVFITCLVGYLLFRLPLDYPSLDYLFSKRGSGNLVFRIVWNEVPNGVVPLLVILFLVIAPRLAQREEKYFRKGCQTHWNIWKQAGYYALLHMFLAFHPLAWSAFLVPGLFFGYKYKKAFHIATGEREKREEEAVQASTACHVVYYVVVIFLFALAKLGRP